LNNSNFDKLSLPLSFALESKYKIVFSNLFIKENFVNNKNILFLYYNIKIIKFEEEIIFFKRDFNMSRNRDLNPRPLPYHGSALPLSYFGISIIKY
jgi:hypothetical protein